MYTCMSLYPHYLKTLITPYRFNLPNEQVLSYKYFGHCVGMQRRAPTTHTKPVFALTKCLTNIS